MWWKDWIRGSSQKYCQRCRGPQEVSMLKYVAKLANITYLEFYVSRQLWVQLPCTLFSPFPWPGVPVSKELPSLIEQRLLQSSLASWSCLACWRHSGAARSKKVSHFTFHRAAGCRWACPLPLKGQWCNDVTVSGNDKIFLNTPMAGCHTRVSSPPSMLIGTWTWPCSELLSQSQRNKWPAFHFSPTCIYFLQTYIHFIFTCIYNL